MVNSYDFSYIVSMKTLRRHQTIRIAAVLLILSAVTLGIQAQEGIGTVTPDEFFEVLEDARSDGSGIVLDIRTPGEFQRGHAPGALNIDFYEADFADELDKLDKSESYFIYCNSGNRSGRSLATFRELGFESVYDLAGGWSYNARRLLTIEE